MRGRTPSDRTLRRWLATGRPRRVEHLIESDPAITERLDAMSALAEDTSDALRRATAPTEAFRERARVGVLARAEAHSTAAVVSDFLTLGYHVGRAMLGEGDRDANDGSADRARRRRRS